MSILLAEGAHANSEKTSKKVNLLLQNSEMKFNATAVLKMTVFDTLVKVLTPRKTEA